MKIDLYARCWNDAHMLGFLFRHYDSLVQRYVFYDDGSTDGSLEILASHPKTEVRPMPPYSDPDSRVLSGLSLLESCWKESRGLADWVIVTDIDEHLYHSDLDGYLRRCKDRGVTIIPALGYAMVAPEFPSPDLWLCQSLTMGVPACWMNKLNIFSPNEIEATNCAWDGIARLRLAMSWRRRAMSCSCFITSTSDLNAPCAAWSSTGRGKGPRTWSRIGVFNILILARNSWKNGMA